MRTIIYVNNDPDSAKNLSSALALDYRLVHCRDAAAAVDAARRREGHTYIVDLDLERGDPFSLLSELCRVHPSAPVLATARSCNLQPVVRAMRSGATDVLPKPVQPPDVREAIRRCTGEEFGAEPALTGCSKAIAKVREELRTFARHDFPILITGESGTGKELAARAVHELSPRRGKSHVARNCAALPAELVESELFGSSKGAYTGATDRPGAFEIAHGGTLFLDEIGDASPETQVKLLRALESGSIWRLGGRTPCPVDVRFVSATSRNLEEAMDRGLFRRDLFYRIETLRVHIPPLRERREDIPALARQLVRSGARGEKDIAAAALELLQGQAWPGNARQLRNVINRAIVLSAGRDRIEAEDIVI